MITELILSAAALVFYFGIEMYYQYKDSKVGNEDSITETKKELSFADIEEGDAVTLFRYYKTGKYINPTHSVIEGVVSHVAPNLIKIRHTWYEEIQEDGWCHRVVHIRKPEKEIRVVNVLPEIGPQGLAGPQGRVWISDTGPR